MRTNYLSLKNFLVFLALLMQLFIAKAQITYTFNYIGGEQTINLQANTYTIETWGADGGDNLGNGSATFLQNGGKGGYSKGVYNLATATTIYVNVGGRGDNSTSAFNTTVSGGYNGGGYGSANTASGKSSGAGGGGATHVATATGILSALVSNQPAVLIVAGGGGGGGESNYASNNTQYNSNGGNGGGTSGLQDIASGYQGRMGKGGTQTAGGGGGDNGSAVAGVPLQGIFGAGGYNTTANGNTSTGGSGAGGGGGGWYGGGAGWVGATAYQAGSGGGGSGYIGGVTGGLTIDYGQPGFVANPDVTGNGYVIIQQLNTPINVTSSSSAICIGAGPVTMTASGVTTYTWLPVGSFAGSNSAIITDNPTSTTVYTVQGTDALGLSVSQFTIYVGGGPINVNVPNPVICAGQSSTLVASGASTYNWSSQSGGFSTITTGTLVINTNSMSGGGYDVIGTDSFGCNSPVASLTITVLSPAAAISGPSITCKGNYYTLSASGADTYTWSTGSNSSSISVSPNVNTVYTLIGGQSQGNVNCYNTASLSVTAYNSPGVGAISNRNNICSGENVLLTAIGAINYTWTNGVTTHTGSTWQVNPISNQTTSSQGYTVTGSNQYNCSNTSTIAITVNPCTGIAENTGVSKLSIYPNPNKGEFVISAAQAMELQLINETGQVLKTIKIDKDKTEIKLNNLSNGIYFIVGKGEQGTVKEKIIVEK